MCVAKYLLSGYFKIPSLLICSSSGNEVKLAGSPCAVKEQSDTQIKCVTGTRKPTGSGLVEVYSAGKGIASGVREIFIVFAKRMGHAIF